MHSGIEEGTHATTVKTTQIYQLSRSRQYQVAESSLSSLGTAYTRHCGDEVELFIEADAQIIYSCEYRGEGCMIMHASANILCAFCQNIPIDSLVPRLTKVLQAFEGNCRMPLKELEIFSIIRHSQTRITCAQLPWGLMQRQLKERSKDE